MTIGVDQFLASHLVGAAEVYPTEGALTITRIPRWAEPQHGNHFMMLNVSGSASGVRLQFITAAKSISITAAFEAFNFPGTPQRELFFELIQGDVNSKLKIPTYRNLGFGPDSPKEALTFETYTFDLDGTDTPVQIWLPHKARPFIRDIQIDGQFSSFNSGAPKWVHYGSSISQCDEALYPTGVWPVAASMKLGLQIHNLGLGGNAVLDPFMAKTIVDQNPDLVSLKLGINSINGASHTLRSFVPAVHGLLDGIRDKLPNTPMLLISPIFCPPHEEGFGPTEFNLEAFKAQATATPHKEMFPSQLNNLRVRDALATVFEARSKADSNLHFMQGLDLLGQNEAHFLKDDLHPNTAGYLWMAEKFTSHPTTKAWRESLPTDWQAAN